MKGLLSLGWSFLAFLRYPSIHQVMALYLVNPLCGKIGQCYRIGLWWRLLGILTLRSNPHMFINNLLKIVLLYSYSFLWLKVPCYSALRESVMRFFYSGKGHLFLQFGHLILCLQFSEKLKKIWLDRLSVLFSSSLLISFSPQNSSFSWLGNPTYKDLIQGKVEIM